MQSKTKVVLALAWACSALPLGVFAQTTPVHVLDWQKISETSGGLTLCSGTSDSLVDTDRFGTAIATLPDLDGDGIPELAVGAPDAGALGDGGRGAVWILYLDDQGMTKTCVKLSSSTPKMPTLSPLDLFGTSVACLGDLDGSGPSAFALAVGAIGDGAGNNMGAIHILFMDTAANILDSTTLRNGEENFPAGVLNGSDEFGTSLVALGDLDGPGPSVAALAVGWPHADFGATDLGAIWILFLDSSGAVEVSAAGGGFQIISSGMGGFPGGVLQAADLFGIAVTWLGDLDGPGPSVGALVCGSYDDTSAKDSGAVWTLFLDSSGLIESAAVGGGYTKIAEGQGGMAANAFGQTTNYFFGTGLAAVPDIDGDAVADLAVGAIAANVEGTGVVWILHMATDGTTVGQERIAEGSACFTGDLDPNDNFGLGGMAWIGPVSGHGLGELAVGARADDDSDPGNPELNQGAVWELTLSNTVGSWQDLGFCLAGTYGCPTLVGIGELDGGCGTTVTLANALESTLSFWVIGLAQLGVPFKGGTLVPDPSPPGVLFVLPTAGPPGPATVVLQAVWPAGIPPATEIFLQAWIQDAAAASGWASSNALKATTP